MEESRETPEEDSQRVMNTNDAERDSEAGKGQHE